METTQNKEKRYLVLDTSAFIKETRFEKFESSELFTVDEVLKEVRDKKARKYLSSIPFRIQTREPTPDAIQAVIDFSKKTGDYTSLSATDISVIALTYTFEKENYGSKNIRTEPTKVILRLIWFGFDLKLILVWFDFDFNFNLIFFILIFGLIEFWWFDYIHARFDSLLCLNLQHLLFELES